MRLIRHIGDVPHAEIASGTVVTIGAFDGLHLGHEQLLHEVRAIADAHDLPTLVMSFEPTPREFFASERPPARLMRFREKFDALAAHGIDYFYCPRFNAAMRDISASDFIRRVLVHGLHTRHIVVGDDFHFARNREGRIDQLRACGPALGMQVAFVPSQVVNGIRVSSTAIRKALWDGDLDTASALLGRHYSMSGTVVKGEKLGRTLGFPTANVDTRRRQTAVTGIFAVRVHGLGELPRGGVASLGTRPTFDGTKPLLEVHLFDFDEDIYGRYIRIDFIARLRNEIKYEYVSELVAQMHKDADNAKSILAAKAG